MTDSQLYFAVGIPLITNIGLFLLLRNDIKNLEKDLRAEIKKIESELRAEIKQVTSELRNEISTLRDMLTGKVIEHTERITKLESKS